MTCPLPKPPSDRRAGRPDAFDVMTGRIMRLKAAAADRVGG